MSVESSEFATEPVPDEHTVPWFRVALVAAMVSFSLPTFLTGLEVAVVASPLLTLEVLITGAIILTVIGSLAAGIGADARLSSYMLNRVAFGARGAALVTWRLRCPCSVGLALTSTCSAVPYSGWPRTFSNAVCRRGQWSCLRV